jgi:glycosyltransferase 2 family protein
LKRFFLGSKLWLLMLPVVGGLLWWSLSQTAASEIWSLFRSLQAWKVLILASVNLLLLLLFSARWWLVLRALGETVPYFRLSVYRMAGAAVSYITPGPHFGGEPLQVALVQKHQVSLPSAISSLFLDRTIELLANFSFLLLGLVLAAGRGSFFQDANSAWIPAVLVLAMPAAHLAALRAGKSPMTQLMMFIAAKMRWQTRMARAVEIVQLTEANMADFCRSRWNVFIYIGLVTVLVWFGMFFEYYLVLQFFGVSMSISEVVIAMTAARLAFLTPLPAGLGLLEAGQVLAFELFGYPAAVGLAVSAWIRVRDLLVVGIGLAAGIWIGLDWRKRWTSKKKEIPT